MATFALRATTPADIPILHRLIRDFAVHERAQERYQITEGQLHEALFSPNPAISSVLADSGGMTVGFALWFFYFGTFSGRYGLWVANLYVAEPYRGIGTAAAPLRVSQSRRIVWRCNGKSTIGTDRQSNSITASVPRRWATPGLLRK